MIIMPRHLTWLKMVLTYKDTALTQVKGRVLLATALATVVTYLHLEQGLFNGSADHFSGSFTHLPFSFVGLALSIFLGFRNSTSYDRFWEGRKLWGQLVNTTRSLSRQILHYARPAQASEQPAVTQWQQEVHSYLIAYVHALRLHLREDPSDELSKHLPAGELAGLRAHKNRPNYLNLRLSQKIAEAWKKQWIHPYHVPLFEDRLHELSNLQGGCERIKSTPIPLLYMVLLHRLVAIYCFALPFGIVDTVGIYTPFVVMIVSYAFMGLDAIGESIENPFQKEPHDLPLGQLSKMIEEALCQQQDLVCNTVCDVSDEDIFPEENDNYQVIL